MKRLFISVLLLILTLPASALAGWRVVQQDTSDGVTSDSILYIEGKKMRGQLVSVDEETFSVDIEEKVEIEGKKRKQTQIVTHTWRYDKPKYIKYDLKF